MWIAATRVFLNLWPKAVRCWQLTHTLRHQSSLQEVKSFHCWKYGRTALILMNSDSKPSGYAYNPDKWIFHWT
jgi:hypothetical protein